MKWIFYFLFLVMDLALLQAQSIDRQVISAGGNNAQSENMNWTIGEVIIQGAPSFTQGFHQGKLLITSTKEKYLSTNVRVYPNPASTSITLVSEEGAGKYQLFSQSGYHVKTGIFEKGRHRIKLADLAIGNYFLRVFANGAEPVIFKIEKIK